jgi:hypothetical protein
MLRIRFLILLGACFLAASAAWADEVGYIDCSNHSDPTQVFGKPRKSNDVVGSLPCGERFTILVYGFYFSRIQTKDGQIGYIYSSLIALDRGATVVQQTPTLQVAAEKTKVPSTRAADAKPSLPTPPQSQAAPVQPAAASDAALPTPATATPAPASPASASPIFPTPASVSPASASDATEGTSTVTQPDVAAADQPATAQPQPAPASAQAAPAQTAPAPTTEVVVPAAQPDPTATTAQPDQPAPSPAPVAAEPSGEPAPAPRPAPAIRPADTRETWEKPLPSVRRPPLVEFYGGFAFDRLAATAGGTATNFNGALGSFGYNIKPWLQLVGDTSYNYVTVTGAKNTLYGNHYGPRYYYRGLSRLRITPFAEALIGGSRSDVTVTGAGGYTTSQNCISYKAGGGIDYRASRHWEIRLIDFDYYRTSFGTNAHQNNYWASAGVVLRLFGGSSDE